MEKSDSELNFENGKPILHIVIDGKESTLEKLEQLEKENIEIVDFINVVTDEGAVKKYGNKGKNGAVEVITKKKE